MHGNPQARIAKQNKRITILSARASSAPISLLSMGYGHSLWLVGPARDYFPIRLRKTHQIRARRLHKKHGTICPIIPMRAHSCLHEIDLASTDTSGSIVPNALINLEA